MNDSMYMHVHPDERAFVDKAADWVERAAMHAVKITDFLDPRQAAIVTMLVNREPDVRVRMDGGYEQAERVRAIIAPAYRDTAYEDAGIRVLEIKPSDGGDLELDHGDYLGAMIGLGIKRDKIGDIHVHPDVCHCLVAAEMGDFISLHLQQVHRVRVAASLLAVDRLRPAHSRLEEMHITVASPRLDGIVSDVLRISRAKVLAPIKNGRCKVNWKVEEDPSAPIKEGDVISMKGFGRFKVVAVEGVSKKGRLRVCIGKYV